MKFCVHVLKQRVRDAKENSSIHRTEKKREEKNKKLSQDEFWRNFFFTLERSGG